MVDWLLKGEPRAAQVEALSRSYYGIATRNTKDDKPFERRYPRIEPAKGWGHLLEMRLGKTPTFLNEFALFRRDHGFKNAIILTPNKFKLDWPIEADRFGLDCASNVLESSDRASCQKFIAANCKNGVLLSINYEALRSKANLQILEEIIGPQTIIGADESIEIKGESSQHTKMAIDIAKRCGARRIMSGKPITQGPHDMWAQLRFIGELDGFVYHAFKNVFCKMGGFQGRVVQGIKNEERFQTILDKCTWAARRVDWLKTPGREYAERSYTLLHEQMHHYKQMQEDFLTELSDGTLIVAEQIITKLLKLQQISSGFMLDENGQAHDIMPVTSNPKALAVKDIMENEVTGKLFVIAHYNRSIDILQETLAKWNPAIIRGRMSNERVVEEKTRFNTDPNCKVIIGQGQATRYGHNLMGQPDEQCYTEIFFENSYSLNDRTQNEERTQGAGQQFPVTIIDLIGTPHDLAPIRALQRKEDVSATLMRYDRSTGTLPPRPELKQG